MADRALQELKGFNLFGKEMVITNFLTRCGNRTFSMLGLKVMLRSRLRDCLKIKSGSIEDNKES